MPRSPEEAKPPLELGAAIRVIRDGLGLSQEQFAQRLGVSTRTVARWEGGVSAPRASVLSTLGLTQAGAASAVSVAGSFGLAGLVAAAVGSVMHASKSLRRERETAALKAMLAAIAKEHNLPVDAFGTACRSLLAEMLDQGVTSNADLLGLLDAL